MSNWLKLEGDVCAGTGALGGMGAEICREFARNGANVVMLDLDEEKVKAAAADLAAEFGVYAEGYKMNATDEAEVQSAVDATIADFGRVDVLVNTAGILRFAATADTLLMGKVASIAAVQLFADPTSAAAVALGGVVVSVNTCANLVGRLSFGQIIDKLGAYKSLLISLVVTIVALVIMSMSFTQSMFFVALALLGFSFGALLVIYPPLTGGAFGTSNIGVNYGIMFLGYAASTWISQPITAVLYHAEAGSAAYQQSFYGAIVIAAIAVVLTVYMMVSDSKKKSA